jgi:hypothetical protein
MHVRNFFMRRPLRIVPLAILAFSLAAPFAEQVNAQSTAQLQTLLNDTVAQFKLVYRHDASELQLRYDEVSKAVVAWREADRTDENNRRLEAWLRAAIRQSMPGSHAALPLQPAFENRPAPLPVAAPEPERSLIPADPAGELPAPPTLRAPTTNAQPTTLMPEANTPPADIEVAKPIAADTTPADSEPVPAAGSHLIEAPANDAMLEADPLPDVQEVPKNDELPDVEPLPEIEEDPMLIEALGDPFLDDAESAN